MSHDYLRRNRFAFAKFGLYIVVAVVLHVLDGILVQDAYCIW